MSATTSTKPTAPPTLTVADLDVLLDLVKWAIVGDDDYIALSPHTGFAQTCRDRRPGYLRVQAKLRKLRGREEA